MQIAALEGLLIGEPALAACDACGQANEQQHDEKSDKEARAVFPHRPGAALEERGGVDACKEACVGVDDKKYIRRRYGNGAYEVYRKRDQPRYLIPECDKSRQRAGESARRLRYALDACEIVPAEGDLLGPCDIVEVLEIGRHRGRVNALVGKPGFEVFDRLRADEVEYVMCRKRLEEQHDGVVNGDEHDVSAHAVFFL